MGELDSTLGRIFSAIAGGVIAIAATLVGIFVEWPVPALGTVLVLFAMGYALWAVVCHIFDGFVNYFEDDVEDITEISVKIAKGPLFLGLYASGAVIGFTNIIPIIGPLLLGLPAAACILGLFAPVSAFLFAIFAVIFIFLSMHSPIRIFTDYEDLETSTRYILNSIIFVVVVGIFIAGMCVIHAA